MPKKNKPGKNGFWQFAMEVRQNKQISSNQELQDYAGRRWANMSKEERKPYEERALMEKNSSCAVKCTSDGRPVEEIEDEERFEQANIQKMKHSIDAFMKNAANAGTIRNETFLIIHINHLVYHSSYDRYYICEISVAPFSLAGGVVVDNVFHRVVKPGKLPLGSYGPAQTHSKETHRMVELVQDEPFEDNTAHVFTDFINYIRQFSSDNSLPVLYAQEKYLQMIQKVLATFCYDYNFTEELRVYNLEYMFYSLRNASAGKIVWPTETFSYTEIDRDIYGYTSGISCDFHDISDITLYCSRCIVIRQGYTICDNCCGDLNINKIPGYHIPGKTTSSNTSTSYTVAEASSMNNFPDYATKVGKKSPFDSDNFPSLGGKSSYEPSESPSSGTNPWFTVPNRQPKTRSTKEEQTNHFPPIGGGHKKKFSKFQ